MNWAREKHALSRRTDSRSTFPRSFVDEKYRMKTVGREIMDYIEREAMEMGLEKIVLNARENALEFYRKLGYEECGKPFDGFAGIVHTRMEKKLQ